MESKPLRSPIDKFMGCLTRPVMLRFDAEAIGILNAKSQIKLKIRKKDFIFIS
jgi:hypothetical protein